MGWSDGCVARPDTSVSLIALPGALYLPFTPFACLRSMNMQRRSRRSATLPPRARPHADTCPHQPPATSHQPPATSQPPPATSHQPPATSHHPPATSHHPPATSHQPPSHRHYPHATHEH